VICGLPHLCTNWYRTCRTSLPVGLRGGQRRPSYQLVLGSFLPLLPRGRWSPIIREVPLQLKNYQNYQKLSKIEEHVLQHVQLGPSTHPSAPYNVLRDVPHQPVMHVDMCVDIWSYRSPGHIRAMRVDVPSLGIVSIIIICKYYSFGWVDLLSRTLPNETT